MSSVGYKTTVKRIEISDDKNLAMGNVVLGAEAIMLKGRRGNCYGSEG